MLYKDFQPWESCYSTQFFTSVWNRPSAADTSFAFRAFPSQVDERTAKFLPLSIPSSLVVCWNFIGSWLLKHWKVRIVYRQWRSNFPRGKENQNTKRKTESYVLFCFDNGISRRWESTTRRFATSCFFLCTWKTSSVGKDRVKKLRIL